MNVRRLKGIMVEKDINVGKLADYIGMDRSTLYRKLSKGGDSITLHEANAIKKVLSLSPEEAHFIFFTSDVA